MSSPPGGERPDPAGQLGGFDQSGGVDQSGGFGQPGGWPQGEPGGWPPPEAGGAVATPAEDRPIRTYLWQSLVATLLCCLPTGIVAIVYATQTQTRLQAGNLAGAREASGRARRWCVISLIAFVVVLLVYVVAIVITVAIVSRND
ncbi:CD225/dispanin family protein [Frankia sp. AvcI1]|uniref:CD225/dispanin family protein n=1 Tax=Frankia sp. AvcI1 TaxID=573496 RepID=UPI0021199991|nr:CD225/dispanin family protein [Frankia sp. AvcI1]